LNKTQELFVSTISDNPKHVFKNLKIFDRLGISGIHFDIMDGNFVPRFGLYPELLAELRSETQLPIEVHLMTKNPDPYIDTLVKAGANRIIVHLEALAHPLKTISLIKESGIEAGIALNPLTGIADAKNLIQEVSLIMLMAINPGIPKHAFIPSTIPKLIELKKTLVEVGSDAKIGIDGGVTFDNAKSLFQNGANLLICGSGTIFKQENSIEENIITLVNSISSQSSG
jgi:ribulose-phosphate 3-epimerase